MYGYGLIGNCQTSAHVSETGSIDWLCFPRPDSPPVFGRLLDKDGGHFAIESAIPGSGRQSYLPNTNILSTLITCEDGSQFRITDFCPRFTQHGRIFKPLSVFRIVEPVQGRPSIRVSCRPVQGWSKTPIHPVRGNSHLRWECTDDVLRLVTNMPMTYLTEEAVFPLKEKLYFGLTWSSRLEAELPETTERFLSKTIDYWELWVKHCSIPAFYQKETIRSALALKLHCFEDTGAILAALTTSLPEEQGHTRNWDYRFCWLRDAYFVLSALMKLGHFEETENFIKFLLGVAERHTESKERLRPVYRLDQSIPLPELEHAAWSGFGSSRPVRSGNQAAEHVQNDVYGEMALTLSPIFFDERLLHMRTRAHEELLGDLARFCARNISQPDAGLWELRDGWREHSFSNLMCWAGLERIHRIQGLNYLTHLDLDVGKALHSADQSVRAAIKEGILRNGPTDETVDAALLLMPVLRFPDADVNRATVERVRRELQMGTERPLNSFLYRYVRTDDFGTPRSSFLICSFWLVQALAANGDIVAARRVMEDALTSANAAGLFAEHYDPISRLQSGNFPQAYSHVGQINAAFAVSPSWDSVL